MQKLLLLAVLAAGCGPTGYYVANVYADQGGLYTQRCAIDGGSHSDKPDPEHCRYERVGPPPAEALSQVGAPPAAPPAPATPPAPPAPPPPAP
ncbi:MAG TPA: hypothetical protein VGG74_21465 [Kofleriaceae bacterium]|jgi:hypothetical protein